MDREATVELAKYVSTDRYIPSIGDIVIRHGWFQRTKWFGVVSGVNGDKMHVICAGLPRLLFTMAEVEMKAKTREVSAQKIRTSAGAYTVLKQGKDKAVVWYV